MKNRPFKIDGVYVEKLDPEKDLENCKPTKLGNMWKAAIGEKEESYYNLLIFVQNFNINTRSFDDSYSIEESLMCGEIISLVDFHKRRTRYPKIKDISFDEDSFWHENDKVSVDGSFNNDILFLTILVKSQNKSHTHKYRYIPWI